MSKDYYSILWIERNASAEEIKKAYRKQAMEHHPDRHGGDKDKENAFKEINEAYAVLSDPAKKARYDQFGSADGASGFSGMGGFDFGDINVEDIFSSVFGNMGGSYSRQRAKRNDVGEDIVKEVHITFSESYQGVKKDISYEKMVHCETCHGHGTKNGEKPDMCKNCHWNGYVTQATRSIFGIIQQTVPCWECHGTGTLIPHPCKDCAGKGRILKKVEKNIEIPAGIDNGMTIKLASEWHTGKSMNGDLYIQCRVDQTLENIRREGEMLFTTVHISPAEAALGTEKKIRFPLIGEREVHIKAGTQHGKKIQFTGDGMATPGRKHRGDLIVTLEIFIPAKLTKEEKSLYQKLLKTEQS